MNSGSSVEVEFVEFIPDELREQTLYVSIPFTTAAHKCACGCGEEVVTPLSPTGWKLIFDGETVSLEPSIGNWGLPCESHYWIGRNRIHWAAHWEQDRVEASRQARRAERKRDYGPPTAQGELNAPAGSRGGFGGLRRLWSRLVSWFRS